MKRKVVTIITAITGERVIVEEAEMVHAIKKHFSLLPNNMFLELLERILKDPSDVFLDEKEPQRLYKFFYQLENNKYLVVVIKLTNEGAYFVTLYPTGSKIRNKHKKMKRVKL
ncbi:MAG: hypothetical protein IIA88_11120 [Bacteroidetes bacterium]|nr:hypothetical protein [Bacteroidota bacterium]